MVEPVGIRLSSNHRHESVISRLVKENHPSSRIGYSGIVPYYMPRKRRPVVACDGSESVFCFLMSHPPSKTPLNRQSLKSKELAIQRSKMGKEAVEKAAKGFLFRRRKYESKGQVFARKAVALASSGGGWNPLEGLEQAYRNVDHEIDDGGRLRSRLEKVHAKQTNRRELLKAKLRETISQLKTLEEQEQRRKAAKAVKKASHGWLDWMSGWLDGPDVEAHPQPWSY